MLSSDENPKARKRVLPKAISQDEAIADRIPPNSDKLFENLPWMNIMAEIAITAAIAEIKVIKGGCGEKGARIRRGR